MVYWTEETLAAEQPELQRRVRQAGGRHHRWENGRQTWGDYWFDEDTPGWWVIPDRYYASEDAIKYLDEHDNLPLLSNWHTVYQHLVEKLGEDNVSQWCDHIIFCPVSLDPFVHPVMIVCDVLNRLDNYSVWDEDYWLRLEHEWEMEYIMQEGLTEEEAEQVHQHVTSNHGWYTTAVHEEIDRVKAARSVLVCEECGYSLNQEEYEFLEDVGFLDPRWSPLMELVKQYRIDVAHEFLMVPLPGVGVPAELPKPDLRDEEGEYLLLDRGDNEYVCPRCIISNLRFV